MIKAGERERENGNLYSYRTYWGKGGGMVIITVIGCYDRGRRRAW